MQKNVILKYSSLFEDVIIGVKQCLEIDKFGKKEKIDCIVNTTSTLLTDMFLDYNVYFRNNSQEKNCQNFMTH